MGQYRTLISYIVKTVIFRKKLIRSVEIIHTLKCNCCCSFCSNSRLSEEAAKMKRQEVFASIDKLAAHGVTAIIFLGGESLTDPYLFEYIRYTKAKKLIPLCQTNGTLLSSNTIEKLADAGLFGITITVHDSIAENHNQIVGYKNALETILAALPELKRKSIKVCLKTVFSRSSYKNHAFDRIVALAKHHGVPLNVNPIMPVGKGFSEENVLNEEEKKEYIKITHNEKIITTHTKNEYDDQCPGGRLYMGILPDGEILPCYFLPISVGNIKNTDIDTARKRAIDLGIFKKGTNSCIVAMNNDFYQKIIKDLYCGDWKLPVQIYQNNRLLQKIKQFSQTL